MANVLGLTMGGPTVIAHGTDEQKARFLAPILSADEMWCQGFSEPESGSDLASLKTRAVLKGDEYVVTGQKVWTTFAHHSKWCMLLARTNQDAPKHRGLTYFLMDMEQAGRRGPAAGPDHRRGRVQRALHRGGADPGRERRRRRRQRLAGGDHDADARARRAGLRAAGARAGRAGRARRRAEGRPQDPVVRQRFAQIAIEAQVLRLLAYRGLTSAMKSGEPGPEGSLGKWLWADINQALTTLAMDVKGPPRSSSTTPGPTASCAPARTRSRAARPRSSRTSSPNASWGCRADELRPDRGPARDPAHRARLPGRALHAREDPRDRARRPAGPALGRDRRARLAGRRRARDRRARGRGRGARATRSRRRRWPRTGRPSCCIRSSRAAARSRSGTRTATPTRRRRR